MGRPFKASIATYSASPKAAVVPANHRGLPHEQATGHAGIRQQAGGPHRVQDGLAQATTAVIGVGLNDAADLPDCF
jgi:hypothetical protein